MNKNNNVFISYPKINLGLDIYKLNKRFNKHSLKSLFVLIKNYKYDLIHINKSNKNKDCVSYYANNKKLNINNDIISKILLFFKNKFFINDNYNIKVIKNIPMQSGLGGGSSNGAVVIKYLINKYNIKLTKKLLLEIAINLGSDICFFLFDCNLALVSSYGNKIKKLNLPIPKIKIIENTIKCSTKEIFQYYEVNKQMLNIKHNNYNKIIKNWNNLKNIDIFNNLLDVSLKLNKNLNNFYNKQSKNTLMTGSGSFFIKLI